MDHLIYNIIKYYGRDGPRDVNVNNFDIDFAIESITRSWSSRTGLRKQSVIL